MKFNQFILILIYISSVTPFHTTPHVLSDWLVMWGTCCKVRVVLRDTNAVLSHLITNIWVNHIILLWPQVFYVITIIINSSVWFTTSIHERHVEWMLVVMFILYECLPSTSQCTHNHCKTKLGIYIFSFLYFLFIITLTLIVC
jgi:hypothetical protein